MRLITTMLVGSLFFSYSSAAPVTSALEQKILVEALSGATSLGVGGLPNLISQRFSDSYEIFTAAEYLKRKYEEVGIEAQILEYSPMDSFPHYVQNTDETYRTYFKRHIPMLQKDFDAYCNGTIDDTKRVDVERRLARVGVEPAQLCSADSAERVEFYITATVRHTTDVTKSMLERRSLATWPNLIAVISTSNSTGEAGARPLCVIGAHMDSVARESGGRGPITSPTTLAPGADDNASGTAAVFTLARALKIWVDEHSEKVKLPCDLAFAHFSGEEEGLLGSLAFVHFQISRPVKWMVNFDMIAYNIGANPAMNVGYDKRFGLHLAEHFAGGRGALRSVLVERNTFIYSSDQIAFWGTGIPALSISEQACSSSACEEPFKLFNPNLHTSEDTAEKLDFNYAAEIIEHSFGGLRELLTCTHH